MTTNPTFKPSEGKREEFRKYLEKNGIMDALTKVLVNLYEEVDKPEDPLQYILDKLALQIGQETHKEMVNKLEDAQALIKDLQDQLQQFQAATDDTMLAGEDGLPPEEAPADAPADAAEAPADQPPE